MVSDSEYEDDEHNEVVLPQTLSSKGNLENNKSAIRLHEIGPRMTLELIKIQNGLLEGEVLYHSSITKTEEEIEAIKKAREEKKRLKDQRRKLQNENVAKKHEKSEKNSKEENKEENEDEVDNDADYYRQEVGEEPDEGNEFQKKMFSAIFFNLILFIRLIDRIIPNIPYWRTQTSICTETSENGK